MVSTLSPEHSRLPTMCYPQSPPLSLGCTPPFPLHSLLAICTCTGRPPDPVRGTLLQASQVQLGNGGKACASDMNVTPLFAHRRNCVHTPAFTNEVCRFLYAADEHATGLRKQARHMVMLTVHL